MTVNVNNPVIPTFNSYGPFCKDAILVQVILPETSNNGIEGTWNPQMLSTANAGTSIYTFTPNSGECATNFELLVVVNPNPQIEAGNNQNICSGNLITLSASGGVQYSWSNSVQNGQPFSPLQTTMYYVTGTDLNGCESIDSVLISVTQTPAAEFTSSVSIGQAPLPVDFTNSSTNATSYLWVFGDGNSTNSNDLSTVNNIFNADGDYPVILVASNGSCIDSATLIISVFSDPWIYIPNVFSPNNDEANELWSIQTKNIEQIEVVILNRWGNKVAEIKTLTDGWNGKTPNGDEVTAGSYFYKYKAKGLNGDELDGHGFFTLVR
jgi:gliding motility-associated-like protein